MSKPRIALVTVWFPPANGVAVNRMQSFARYLGEDFELEIVTMGERDALKAESFGRVHYLSSSRIWTKIAHKSTDGKLLHHSKTLLKLTLHKLGASPYKSWRRRAEKTLTSIHNQEALKGVISSYAPEEAHDVAFEFMRKHQEVIWIADMRDEMGSNPFLPASEKKRLREKELRYLPYIDAISTVSLPILEDFQRVLPGVSAYLEVRNGFDHTVAPKYNFNEKFTLVYAGTFYGKRKPDVLFEAVKQLLEEGKIEEDIAFHFIGANKNFHIPQSLQPFVEFVPKLSYTEAIEQMAKADCNLLVNPPLGTKGQFSGKVFDYISVEKPILALVDQDDVAAELIRSHHAGIPVDFHDVDEAGNAFLTLYGYWKRREEYPIDRSKTQEVHRKFQVEKLTLLLNQLVNP